MATLLLLIRGLFGKNPNLYYILIPTSLAVKMSVIAWIQICLSRRYLTISVLYLAISDIVKKGHIAWSAEPLQAVWFYICSVR